MSLSKPAFAKPIHSLVANTARIPEQIKGRVLLFYVETLPKGKEKAIAVIVGEDKTRPLKSVLVLEAWNPGDISHMKKHLQPLRQKVVSLTNCLIKGRGKTLVFYDSVIKCSYDTRTNVQEAADDPEFPVDFPTLPDIQAATSVKSACMISIIAAVTEAGSSQDRLMPTGVTKPVANLKVATSNTTMTAAFWEGMAQQMGSATVGQVYRIDWAMLKPEAGKYSLGSLTATSVSLQSGAEAATISDNLAKSSDMLSMSTTYSVSFEDKMNKPVSKGDIYALETMETLNLAATGIVLVGGVFMQDARGMATDSPGRAWYTGCSKCKKQLDTSGSLLQCPDHGQDTGKRVYGGQLLFADPSHKKEFAVWEEMLRRMIKEFLGHEDLDREDIMEDLVRALRAKEICIRVGVGHKKNGSVSFDVFDMTPQVTHEGCISVYRAATYSVFEGSPAVVPSCCQNVKTNALGQLTVTEKSITQAVETAKLLLVLTALPVMEVMKNIDGVKVTLKCKCLVCESPCTLFVAGMSESVTEYLRMPVDLHFLAFVQSVEPDGGIPIGYHIGLTDPKTLIFDLKVFKYQAAQFLISLAKFATASAIDADSSGKRTKVLEELMADVRPDAKRLKLSQTMDGNLV
jgi:hypothetical protein